jgi:hypothetical protein
VRRPVGLGRDYGGRHDLVDLHEHTYTGSQGLPPDSWAGS